MSFVREPKVQKWIAGNTVLSILHNSKKYKMLFVNKEGTFVYDYKNKRKLSFRINNSGYVCCNVYLVHRIVAETFCKKDNEKLEVNHLDGNKRNNHYLNLEWTTHSKNMKYNYQVLNYRPTRLGSHMTEEHRKIVSQTNSGAGNPAAKTRKIIFTDNTSAIIHTRKEMIKAINKKLNKNYHLSTIKNIIAQPEIRQKYMIKDIIELM